MHSINPLSLLIPYCSPESEEGEMQVQNLYGWWSNISNISETFIFSLDTHDDPTQPLTGSAFKLVAFLHVASLLLITGLKTDWSDRLQSWTASNTITRRGGRLECWSMGWGQSEYPTSQNRPKQDLVTTCPLTRSCWPGPRLGLPC